MRTLIRNGRVITAVDDYRGDVLVEGETVAAIGLALDVEADRVIDAAGCYVIPGGVDPHTHMQLELPATTSSDDFESGTIAAAHGGTTTIVDFATQAKGEELRRALDARLAQAEGRVAIDYGLHMICVDLPEARLRELRALVDEGVPSFKLFMAYPGTYLVDDATIFRAMTAAGEAGGLVCMHAENGVVIDALVRRALAEGRTAPRHHAMTRPTTAEAEGVARAIALAEMAEAPVHIVHLSCGDALDKVVEARDRGLRTFAETCPQYLFLDDSRYESDAFDVAKWVMTPPLRHRSNHDALWRGLRGNDLQLVATDHCPFCFKDQKELGRGDFSKIPNGAPGVEHRMSLVFTGGVVAGRIGLNRFVELTSTFAAKLFGLFPRKGTIAVGSDADIVVFDPAATSTISATTHHMRVDYSAYEGMTVRGEAKVVMSRGKVIVETGRYAGKPGDGRFVKRGRLDPTLV